MTGHTVFSSDMLIWPYDAADGVVSVASSLYEEATSSVTS